MERFSSTLLRAYFEPIRAAANMFFGALESDADHVVDLFLNGERSR